MATSSIREIWKLIEQFKEEVDLLMNNEALVLLIYLSRHEGITQDELIQKVKKHFQHPKTLLEFLLSNKFLEEKNGSLNVSEKGKEIVKIIEYQQYDISKLPEDAVPGYILKPPPLGKGSTSVTFKSIKGSIEGPVVVLKIFKPGILDHINFWKKLRQVSALESPYLVIPYNYGEFKWNGLNLKYLEMRYIEGVSLKQFLKENINIDLKETLKNFISEIGGSLKTIQEAGLIHGDLHENNILVVEDKSNKGEGIYHFKIIDFIGIAPTKEFRQYELTDFEYFKENFSKIIRKYATAPSGVVDRKKLGERFSHIYESLLEGKYTKIEDVIAGLSEKLPEKKEFSIENPFTYLIFEQYDINNPLWLKRFEPDPAILKKFTDFSHLICSGPRGCGKSIYLGSLSFVPRLIKLSENDQDLKEKIAYFKGIFGIYFACRLGEFKIFSKKAYPEFTFYTQLFIKHIIILRIIRKTVGLIDRAYSEKIFDSVPEIKSVLKFIKPYLTQPVYLTLSARKKPFKELETILRNEEIEYLNILGKEEKCPPQGKLLNEKILENFFYIIRENVPELSNIKFYIIFDDVSDPQVSEETQKILNCLMASHNEIYCCKFSMEKYAYTFEDMFGKALQVPHDYTYIDFSGVGIEPYDRYTDKFYEEYFEKIVNKQLELGGYKKGIRDYLEPLPYAHQELIDLLSKKESTKVKFAGWDIIVQLSSRSAREVLIICDEILKQYGNDQELLKSGKSNISVDIQHKAIMKYSRDAYQNLINIEYVGKEIFLIVKNFGEISKTYLSRPITNEEGRHLFSIEKTFKKDITRGKISEELRDVFAEKGYKLSKIAKLTAVNDKWKIEDRESKEPAYIIDEKNNKLDVYAARKYEVISIERRDDTKLSEKAEDMLKRLIRHSVFVDRGLSFSREQIGLVQKFTLHKKYTPALMTTYREREHLRLPKEELEEFLLHPDSFREHFLKKEEEDKYQLKLWDFEKR